MFKAKAVTLFPGVKSHALNAAGFRVFLFKRNIIKRASSRNKAAIVKYTMLTSRHKEFVLLT